MFQANLVPLSYSARTVYHDLCKPLCKKMDLGQTAFDILMLLGTLPEVETARDIAYQGSIKKNLISLNVKKLIEQGYIRRQPMPNDHRQLKLAVTEKALPVIECGMRIQEYYYRYLVKGLTKEEVAIYQKCMNIIASNMHELSESQIEIEGMDLK